MEKIMAKTPHTQEAGSHLSFGILLGMIIGSAFGVLLGNLAVGIVLGIGLGALLGGVFIAANDKNNGNHSH